MTNLNQIKFSGKATGPDKSSFEVFLIGGGGVPDDKALICQNWEKISGANNCVSDGSSTIWSFYWEDNFPSVTEYSIRAKIFGVDQTATVRC